ncbi:SDR family NAD(P)-dependent oxidoreductase [Cohnella hashimotonis]|uniref:Glucose 1-dehydrogenase n=1 Tax=Cohnella hashimotonis TaxID=2826895 RepID=A0ABT6TCK8_9BACL|nr:glucose 1-dehydrogenase [Cohnella hashimotonis]MDI4643689.1 glucose 1-dehydrogenase [Cohnella hashimotonis]
MRFHAKAALVTGGSKGIGLAVARLFVREGASVAIVSNEEAADAAEQLGELAGSRRAIAIRADVSRREQVQAAVRQASDAFGGIDILVNSAGVQRYGDVTETDESVWDEVIGVNLKGMFLTSKYCIPEMRKRGGGAIVHVSSVQAYAAQQRVAAYSASKGGINALTRAMAVDHAADRIRVNAVCPASVDTPMLRWAADLFKGESTQTEVLRSWSNMHPIGRVGTAEEVAELIAYLCSDQAGFITGADIKIDGGLLATIGVKLPD